MVKEQLCHVVDADQPHTIHAASAAVTMVIKPQLKSIFDDFGDQSRRKWISKANQWESKNFFSDTLKIEKSLASRTTNKEIPFRKKVIRLY